MEKLIMAGQLILALSILVTFHEAGHFFAARAFGIKVEKFYLFFDAWGKKLFSFKKGDTEYGIGWLPLGGYVKIAGMIDESFDKDQMKSEPEDWEFRSKPAWQRFIVMIGGIVVNLILGFVLLTFHTLNYEEAYLPVSAVNEAGIYPSEAAEMIGFQKGDQILSLNGNVYKRFNDYNSNEAIMGGTFEVKGTDGEIREVTVPDSFLSMVQKGAKLFEYPAILTVQDVLEGSEAERMGLQAEDQILSLQDTAVEVFSQFTNRMQNFRNRSITMQVLRDQDTVMLAADVDSNGTLGFHVQGEFRDKSKLVPYTWITAAKYSKKDAWENLYYNVVGFGKIFRGEIKARDSVQSVVGIASIFGGTWDWGRFWRLTAILSLILGFMNALPIPALDGGHMMFLTYEMITGRPPAEKVLLVAQYIGVVILLLLMVLTVANDILKAFGI